MIDPSWVLQGKINSCHHCHWGLFWTLLPQSTQGFHRSTKQQHAIDYILMGVFPLSIFLEHFPWNITGKFHANGHEERIEQRVPKQYLNTLYTQTQHHSRENIMYFLKNTNGPYNIKKQKKKQWITSVHKIIKKWFKSIPKKCQQMSQSWLLKNVETKKANTLLSFLCKLQHTCIWLVHKGVKCIYEMHLTTIMENLQPCLAKYCTNFKISMLCPSIATHENYT